ncbi:MULTISPECIES: restriction endonuclease subunit S [Shewanella]|uniref:Restriction endonuclease subunit S n=1 Tax=Shewanella marisflavi TaxID=260364 RepID=A0ABX5WQB4_9GAMM|nr:MULTISPECIES: restriction endonuclease subunit S [Shewanella]QDF76758.1 restriction endonuclease subunit S [Shewanella marisflavi]
MKNSATPITELLSFMVDNRGKTVPAAESGFPLIATNCIKHNSIYPTFENVRYVDEKTKDSWFRAHPEPNDIIFVNKGTPGRVCLVPDPVPFCFAQDMIGFRCDPEKIDYQYLFAVLRSDYIQKKIENYHVGLVIPHFKKGDLKHLNIPRLENRDAELAAGKLYLALSEKIELNNRINAELEAMAKTLYDYWFVQFDFPDDSPQGQGKPYKTSGGKMVYNPTLKREIPEGWDDGTLEDLGQIVGGSTPSTQKPENFATDGIPWITPNDLSNNQGNKFISRGGQDVSVEGIKNASLKKYPAGTVLLSSRAPIGYMAISRNEVTTNQGFKSFVPNKGYSTEIIYYTVKNSLKAITQYASGSTFKEVSGGTLKTVKVVLPSVAMSDTFTEKVKPIFSQQDFIERENAELVALRDWLLPMLMNGQVIVGEAS